MKEISHSENWLYLDARTHSMAFKVRIQSRRELLFHRVYYAEAMWLLAMIASNSDWNIPRTSVFRVESGAERKKKLIYTQDSFNQRKLSYGSPRDFCLLHFTDWIGSTLGALLKQNSNTEQKLVIIPGGGHLILLDRLDYRLLWNYRTDASKGRTRITPYFHLWFQYVRRSHLSNQLLKNLI